MSAHQALLTADEERQLFLENEQKQALMFLEMKHTADLLTKAGITTSVQNIAEFGNMYEKDVDAAIKWFRAQGPGVLPIPIDETATPVSELDTLIGGLMWIANRRLTRTKGRTTPPLDRSVLGMQKVMALTGLGRVRILELVAQHESDIRKVYSDFIPSWVKDDQSIIQKNAINQHPETKRKLIREAILEISQGRVGQVSAEQLAAWNNGAIGLGKRAIDKELSTPAMKDLDKYRVNGSHVGLTDADREARYLRSMTR